MQIFLFDSQISNKKIILSYQLHSHEGNHTKKFDFQTYPKSEIPQWRCGIGYSLKSVIIVGLAGGFFDRAGDFSRIQLNNRCVDHFQAHVRN